MKKFFLALYNLLIAVNGMKTVDMWNGQDVLLAAGKMELFQTPAAFIEFDSSQIMQLGNGVQLFDPLIFKIHILHWQLDNQLGSFERNLDVYDLKDLIYAAIQRQQPNFSDDTDPISSCVRIAEKQDYNHAGLYHYVQTYKTTLTDYGAQEPVGGSETTIVPMPLEIQQTKVDSADINEPYLYNFTPAP